ncbi:hypothetical protein BIW11_02477 [Tropilaelaps mercedesae]|uniref:Transmembrane protein n=1 Tax=Tropilaelaps mercedesae TaxID=418985 RepID=A0A1V9Y2I8_9ACAR|nr:hypothetical protein BIW11_02477 [Tropilaelaps mercedesae]
MALFDETNSDIGREMPRLWGARWSLWPSCCLPGRRYFVFLTGALFGFLATIIFLDISDVRLGRSHTDHTITVGDVAVQSYIRWLHAEGVFRVVATRDKQKVGPQVAEAQYLFDRVLIACIVFGSSRRQSRAIVGTWGRHCNSLDFVADFEDKYIPVTVSMKRLQENQNQWTFLTRDSTFAIIENLRRLVAPLNSSEVHYLGHAMRKTKQQARPNFSPHLTVNVVNGGIVLSQGAVFRLVYALGSDCQSKVETQLEDSIAILLGENEVPRPDTRDHLGRARFLARSLDKLLRPAGLSPYDSFVKDSIYASPIGPMCCSPLAVSLADVDALEMHLWEYIIARMGVGVPTSRDRGVGGAPLRDSFVPPVVIEGEEPRALPKEPGKP